jgi:glycine betaine catabolism B
MDFEVRILGIDDLGAGIRRFRLERPSGFSYRAGQYFALNLGPGLIHAFSFSGAPAEDDISFTTRMSESDFKKSLASLRPGDIVRVRGPMGEFTLREGKALFLAGGIGVTPFSSMLRQSAAVRSGLDAVLIWGVNSMEDAFFRKDFEALPAGLRVDYVPAHPPQGWEKESGFIGAGTIRSLVPDFAERMVYVCGPPKMVEAMGKVLSELNVPAGRMVTEQFGGY